MKKVDFVVVGSGGGGGTISWLLAKAGFRVVLLEQGNDFLQQAEAELARAHTVKGDGFNPQLHDEYRFRLERPDPKRRLRGAYNTFRTDETSPSRPLGGKMGGFTASVLGGGSVLWGTWSFRALPIDFCLATHFRELKQDEDMQKSGYSVPNWPVKYADFEPYYNLAEAMFGTCGDRKEFNHAVTRTHWFREFKERLPSFGSAGNWEPSFPFQGPPYPMTPVGYMFHDSMKKFGLHPVILANSLISPGEGRYKTKNAIGRALHACADCWPNGVVPEFWRANTNDLWSDRARDACNMCGYCGEFACWGRSGPKSGTRVTTIRELTDLPNAEIITDSLVYEVMYNSRTRRATGVRYLDITDPDNPRQETLYAHNVVVSCGAVQSARLLLMSGPPGGLGNRFDQVGRNACFHIFGLGAKGILRNEFQGKVHSEYGHTGNITAFDYYFLEDTRPSSDNKGKWCKGGTLASAAKKNPLENANSLVGKSVAEPEKITGIELLKGIEPYARLVEMRVTGDDLPMPRNRVDLDPNFVDEYGFPVARITRNFGPHERWMAELLEPQLTAMFDPFVKGNILTNFKFSGGDVELFGDHQLGTCRMGEDPANSVLDRHCRVHDVPNLFVVDSSFMPTGLGVNPMKTVVANALRVGTWIVQQSRTFGSEMSY
jgi:choline dehydrogenase-like flavoprotein